MADSRGCALAAATVLIFATERALLVASVVDSVVVAYAPSTVSKYYELIHVISFAVVFLFVMK